MKALLVFSAFIACSSLRADTLPNVTSNDVLGMFEDLGFPHPEPSYTREQTECKMRGEVNGNLFTLELFGPPFESVKMRSITAMTQNNTLPESRTGEMSLSFLCLAASTPYAGSTPEAARIWLAQNIDHPAEKMFGQVKMQLFTSARSRILRISTESLTPSVAAAPATAKPSTPKADSRIKSDKLPTVGMTYFDVEWDHHSPVIKDAETGWATWPNFRAKFKDGVAVEVERK